MKIPVRELILLLLLESASSGTMDMICSGCDSVIQRNNTAYYCPNDTQLLHFECSVYKSSILRWRVTPFSPVPITISNVNNPESCVFQDPFAIVIETVETNFDGSENNFTVHLWFDIQDVRGDNDLTVICESDSESENITFIPLGHPVGLEIVNSTSSRLEVDSDQLYVYYEWQYPPATPDVLYFETEILVNNERVDMMRVEENMRNGSGNITQLSLPTYSVFVSAVGRCGRTGNITEIFKAEKPPTEIPDCHDVIIGGVAAAVIIILIIVYIVTVMTIIQYQRNKRQQKLKDTLTGGQISIQEIGNDSLIIIGKARVNKSKQLVWIKEDFSRMDADTEIDVFIRNK